MKRLLATTALFSFAALLGPAPAFAACVLGGVTYTCTGTEAGTITLAADSEFDTSGGDANITGEVTGPYGIAKIGANTLALGYTNNSYSGITRIDAGTLSIGNVNQLGDGSATNDIELNGGTLLLTNSISTNRDIIMTGNGTIDSTNNPITLGGVISGSGKFTKLGNGAVMTLTGNNTFSGIMELGQGAIAFVSSSNNLGDGSATNDIELNGGVIRYGASFDTNRDIAIGNGGTVDTNGFDTELSGVISGAQILLKQGTGTLTLSGNNTYSSLTQISAGTVAVSASNNLGDGTGNNNIRLGGNATLKYDAAFNMGRIIILNGAPTDHANVDTNGFDVTWSGDVQGGGFLTKVGAGKLTLTGDNTNNTGALAIQGGTLSVSSTQRLGNISRLELDGGGLEITGSLTTNKDLSFLQDGEIDIGANNVTLSGVLSGAGDLVKDGSGTLTVSGTNTYTGDTTISDGKLIAMNTSAIHGAVANSGTLEFNNAADGTFAGQISGTGDFIKEGAGNLTLSTSSSYSGKTYINDGTITVNDSSGLGDGSAGNDIEFDGGTLVALNGFSTNRDIIFTGDGTYNANITETWSGILSGTGRFTKEGNGGNLTLTGTNTYSGITELGTASTISVSNSRNLGDESATNDIEFNGGRIRYLASFDMSRDIALTGAGALNTNGFNTELSGVISGTGRLIKEGAGTLTLTQTNTLSGVMQINDGTLAVSASDQLGDESGTNYLQLGGGGQLKYLAAFDTTRGVEFGGGNGVIDTNGFDVTISGSNGGHGVFVKTGSGTLTLGAGSSNHAGAISINGGTLAISAAGNLGNTSGITFDGGALEITGALTTNKNMTFTQDGEIDIGANNVTLSGTLSGAGDLVKDGAGTLTVSGTNTYTGDTTISAGKLIATNASAIQGDISNSGILEFDMAGNGTYTGNISGSGELIKEGAGTLTLNPSNSSYTGMTRINDGTLSISASSNLGDGSSTNDIEFDGGALLVTNGVSTNRDVILTGDGAIDSQNNNVTLSGVISGTGRLTKSGNGSVLTLSGTNTYSGVTQLNIGAVVSVGASNNLGDESATNDIDFQGGIIRYTSSFDMSRDIAVTGNGTINTNGFDTELSGVISGTGHFNKTGAGTLTLTNTNTYSGHTEVGGGILAVSASDQIGDASGTNEIWVGNGGTFKYLTAFNTSRRVNLAASTASNFDTNGFDVTLSGDIGGGGILTKVGAGTLILSGTSSNYYSGTSINDGILSISAASNLGNTTGITFDGGALEITGALTTNKNMIFTQDGEIDIGANNVTLSGTLSGAGDLVKDGSGTLTVSGTNTYTGDTTISAGRLIVNNTAGIHGAVDNAGILEFNIAGNGTYAGAISGAGSFVKDGAGNLTFTGSNLYTGGTTIEDGAIIGTTSTLTGDFDLSGGDLVFNQNTNGVFSGLLTGSDSLIKNGTGNISLTGSNAAFAGSADVNAGILSVNSNYSGTTANVASGGTLGGNGTLGSAVIDGKLAPGNSIGTITVNGNVDFNTGSIYEVEISPTQSDKLVSTGVVTIHNGASVNILAGAGTYTNGFVYNIITSGSLVGTFDTLTEDLAFFDGTLQYTGTDVNLLIERNDVDFSEIGQDPTQVQVGSAVTELGNGNTLYDAFSNLSTTQAQGALDTLSGEHNAGITGSMTRSAGIIQSALTSHMTGLHHGGSKGNTGALAPISSNSSSDPSEYVAAYLEPMTRPWDDATVWFEAIGTMGHSGSEGSTPSQDRHSYGALGGVDIAMDTGGYYGFFGGYETGEIETDSQRASSDMNNYHAGVYATKPLTHNISLSGGLGTTYHDIDTVRYVVFPGFQDVARGDTAGQTVSAFAEVAHTMEFEDVAIEPFANVSITYSHVDGYTETDINGSGLVVDSANNTTPASVLGVRGGKQVYLGDAEINLNASLGWQHVYGDTDSSADMRFAAGTSTFESYGPAMDRDAAIVGLGIDGQIGEATRAYAAYDGTLSADDQDHGFKLGLRINF